MFMGKKSWISLMCASGVVSLNPTDWLRMKESVDDEQDLKTRFAKIAD